MRVEIDEDETKQAIRVEEAILQSLSEMADSCTTPPDDVEIAKRVTQARIDALWRVYADLSSQC